MRGVEEWTDFDRKMLDIPKSHQPPPRLLPQSNLGGY
jgi:hypothetical protein